MNETYQKILSETKQLDNKDIMLAYFLLEGTEYESIIKDEIISRRMNNFISAIPRFAL